MRHLSRATVLVLVVMLLAACDSDNSDDAVPTLMQLPELTESAEPGPVGLPPVTQQTVDSTPEATPPVAPPDLTLQPTEQPEFAGPASTPAVPDSAGVQNASEEVTDFTALEVGRTVRLYGLLEVVPVGAEGSSVLVLYDEADVIIEVMLPPGLVEQMIGTMIGVSGTIVSGDETITGQMGIIPSDVSGISEVAGGAGLPPGIAGAEATAETTANVPPGSADATPGVPQGSEGPPFTTGGPPVLAGGEQLDFTLEADLTALAAYDGLMAEVGDALDAYFWSRLSGSSEAGWLIEFYDPDAEEPLAYNVQPDGTVYVVAATAPVVLPGAEILPIERERVVVDSDVAAAQAGEQAPGPNLGAPSLMLAAVDGDGIEWTVLGLGPMTLDATVAPQE